jgi:hypothetical protein
MRATSVILKKLPEVNYYPVGESSPNAVALRVGLIDSQNRLCNADQMIA